MNVSDAIADYAVTRPDTPALIDGDRTISYRDFHALIGKTAAHLAAQGVIPGDRVGICLKDDADHVIALFAAARLGAIAFVIDWRATEAEREARARAFAPALVLIEPRRAPLANAPTATIDDAWARAVAAIDPMTVYPGDGNAPFLLSLSSGTTGMPKGVILTHLQAYSRALPYLMQVGMTGQHRFFSALPLCYAGTFEHYFFSLMSGSTVILYPTLYTAEEYVDAVARYEASYAFLVPTVLRWLLDLPARDGPLLPSLEWLVSAGAPLFPEEKRQIARRICPNFMDMYGTSATGPIALLGSNEFADKAGTVGRPTTVMTVEIVDEDHRPVESGTVGRLRCRGPSVSSGFFGGSGERTDDDKFIDGWYYTGDLATIDEDGYVAIVGRVSNVIIRGGANVYAEEVEAVLHAHPAVSEAAVVGRPSKEWGEEVAAFVVAKGEVDRRALTMHCRKQLTPYKVPEYMVFVESLPKTAAGKVKKADLVKQFDGDA